MYWLLAEKHVILFLILWRLFFWLTCSSRTPRWHPSTWSRDNLYIRSYKVQGQREGYYNLYKCTQTCKATLCRVASNCICDEFLPHHYRPLLSCNASLLHAKCLVSCFLVTFLFPISGMWSGAQLPDNDTYCGDINTGSKGWLLLDISAGVTQTGLLPSKQNEGWLPPPPHWRQANHPHNNRVRGQWQENKPASFSFCVWVYARVCVFSSRHGVCAFPL